MKNLLLTIPAWCLLLTNCGSATCDTSTAAGAAECYCQYRAEYKEAEKNHDEEALEDITKKLDAFETETEQLISEGAYSIHDVDQELEENCLGM